MTSLAFSLGVTPLAVAVGASAASQNAIGTGVLGGMITATVIAVPFVPVFFVFVVRLFGGRKALEAKPGEEPSLPLEAPAE
jgi:multidrug efflux pump